MFFILSQFYLFVRYLLLENILLKIYLFIFGPPKGLEEDAKDKIVVITGANTGLGKATALKMAAKGAKVIMACRNLTQGKKALLDICKKTGSNNLELMKLDLSDLDSVRSFASELKGKYPKINILINNAGIYYPNDTVSQTKEGFEQHFGVNYIAHFLLTNLLLENLKRGAPSRIVNVSSLNQMLSIFDFNDLGLKKSHLGIFNTMPYNNSKFANSLFTKELAKRLVGTNVSTFSLCPGHVMTDIFRSMPPHLKLSTHFTKIIMGLSPEDGCEIVLFCALSKEILGDSGSFFHCYKKFKSANDRYTNEISSKLWTTTEKMLQTKFN